MIVFCVICFDWVLMVIGCAWLVGCLLMRSLVEFWRLLVLVMWSAGFGGLCYCVGWCGFDFVECWCFFGLVLGLC